MSLSDAPLRRVLMALGLTAALAVSGCSGFTPVYGGRVAAVEQYDFVYDEPKSRLDQVIYADLRLRLGAPSPGPDAVRIAIATRSFPRELTQSDVLRPTQQAELTVIADIWVIAADGDVLLHTERRASAWYMTSSQVLASTSAERDAAERAAKSLGEQIRLAIIGALEVA